MTGKSYKSPISLQCQANHVVLLSDGVPTKDDNHNSFIQREIGEQNCPYITDDNGRYVQNCLAEIADYMFNNDIYEKNIEAAKGNQHVTTHTVGFTLGQELLAEAARRGGGSYYLADNADELELAFNAIFREVLATNTTFSSPGVSVNNFNQLNHLDTLYFSVFEPVVNPLWPGNLKRYRLKSDGTIVDQNDKNAVDSATGFFKEGAQSYWSSSADGANVRLGGVAGELDHNNSLRNVYTYYPGSTSKSLKASVNNVSVSNSANLKKEFFGDGDMSNAQHEALIRWTRGQDVADEDRDGQRSESRQFMADPLHSRPYLQVYGGSEEKPDTTVFYGDNQGFLHAVDGETGKLHFSFIPAELLKNQSVLMRNQVAEYERPYGMDGSVVPWFQDINGNRIVDSGDSVYIYAGMRRGGRNYYGLDVTERDSPSMLWTIRGGIGDFKELGQSWSDPVKQRVRLGNQIRDVLFFSGGYDSQQDSASVLTEDGIGRAIYMVDAKTGERLWWAGHGDSDADLELNDMRYSIPATPTVIDVNGDGLADQLYVGDMGGQIWRVDFQHGLEAENFATGGVIARFAGGSSETNRRFYHSPDISGTLKNGNRYLNLAIGSGYQAHPLDNTINDRFYKLTISSVNKPANEEGTIEYKTLTEADLLDVTDNVIQEGDKTEREGAETALAESNGWYLRLARKGEKVLSSSTTLRGDLYFTTFEPSASLDACIPAAGQSRLYHVKLRDGRAVVNYDGVGTDDKLTASDRYVTLKTLGLPPSPIPVTIEGKEVIVAGTETLMPPEPEALVRKIYWYEE
ncbi:pilus assembly protein PilY [Marinobacter adhaerens]|uniref:Pilus assembly protein PilY n=1 Tax=Marinobacter adhaerens TaxID=1033846 RepID=A0A851HW60_9GAMM|nr:PilC/PilY family type IV pilus protein [Marinobacter adhaerens]NWN92930.1 pilus assembly protein PilY [Marinobacter adhaerens]